MKSPEEIAANKIFSEWRHREDFYHLINELGFKIANEQEISFSMLEDIPGLQSRSIGEQVVYTILIKVLSDGKFNCNDINQ